MKTSLLTKAEFDTEVLTRISQDSSLASYIGSSNWELLPESPPHYGSSTVSVSNGVSLTEAVNLLDTLKNKTITWKNYVGMTVVSNVDTVKFGQFFTVNNIGNSEVYITLSGNVVWNLAAGTEELTGTRDMQWFGTNKFCTGIKVTFRTVGSIGSTYSVVSSVTLAGTKAKLG